jgi:ubiquinol-cytochrome c reductase subunit 6
MSDEKELMDPQETLRAECSNDAHCAHAKADLEACTQRVNSRSQTEETCSQELYDFMHSVDHCVSKTLFNHLK